MLLVTPVFEAVHVCPPLLVTRTPPPSVPMNPFCASLNQVVLICCPVPVAKLAKPVGVFLITLAVAVSVAFEMAQAPWLFLL